MALAVDWKRSIGKGRIQCRCCGAPIGDEAAPRLEALTHCEAPACQADRADLLAYIATGGSAEIRLDAARELLRRIDLRQAGEGGALDPRRLYAEAERSMPPLLRTLRVVRAEEIHSGALS